jgi:hypothetical protein
MRTQLLTVKDVIDAVRLSRASVSSSPKARTRKQLLANARGIGAHPTAIAIVYCSTESILDTATHRLGTSSSCMLSPNASPRNPNPAKCFWLPHHQAANRFRQADKKGINHDNGDGRGVNCG